MNEEKCKNCKFCHELKELVNHEWKYGSVCTFFPQTESNDNYDSFALVVDGEGMCEVFTPRRNDKD